MVSSVSGECVSGEHHTCLNMDCRRSVSQNHWDMVSVSGDGVSGDGVGDV